MLYLCSQGRRGPRTGKGAPCAKPNSPEPSGHLKWIAGAMARSFRAPNSAGERPDNRPDMASYLQPGSFTGCPGGWHFAPGSSGPLLLRPGPKSGSAKAHAAEIDRTATARSRCKRSAPHAHHLLWGVLHSLGQSSCATRGCSYSRPPGRNLQGFQARNNAKCGILVAKGFGLFLARCACRRPESGRA